MQAKELLKAHGLKYTPRRAAILEQIALSGPIAAEEVYARLSAQNEKLNLSTVYRALEALSEKQVVEKVVLAPQARAYYALHQDGHQHYFLCTSCGKTIEINDCPLSAYARELEEHMGLSVQEHCLQLSGLCRHCKERKK